MGRTAVPPDEVLTARLRAGDEETFGLVLDAWSGGMVRLAMSFVSTRDTAEEVVQETWLAVFRGIDGFEGRSMLKTWVYRILVNIARTRGAQEHRTVPFASLLPEDEGPTVDASRFQPPGDPHPSHWTSGGKPQPWQTPEGQALRGEARAVITAALDELPARLRTVITLRDVEGYESQEVCTLLGITPGNQRVLLHRARAAVRARLEDYFAGTPSLALGAGRRKLTS
ncbi:sigma-70 family RNA polymerase sigma factor [Streptomyces sp. P9(2023)]|uniref:RNA polymerase sigma factor n=1 Tax=Streptomyces sp. P9(2023) TaxID=3064394 RepID=UPI0028F3F8F9|nr:sigma-70 family RNA polymerase sigma factor [Streptomyces sp. P9(2023)]MDT9691855.1 sigma-70 family RNA polymerase sigma factor [Streptomyces sp. P9(2023)]